MNNQALLKKYVTGTCTPSELNQVLQYIATPKGQAALEHLMEEAKQTAQYPPLDQSVSQRIYQRLEFSMNRRRAWMVSKVAASVLLLLLGGIFLYTWLREEAITYATDYGETKTVVLPDSSTVILNANSRLTLSDDWSQMREVWLEGEAYFQVNKIKNATLPASEEYIKFVVRTDRLNVEVLGTEFNVRQRPEKTAVLLKSGKVRLSLHDQPDTLSMQPGELVTLRSQSLQLDKEKVDPEPYTAWTEHRLVFEGETLQEIARIIEDTYGYKVIIQDENLRSKRFQGSVPAEDLDILLDGLSVTFDMHITKLDRQIIIQP